MAEDVISQIDMPVCHTPLSGEGILSENGPLTVSNGYDLNQGISRTHPACLVDRQFPDSILFKPVS